MNYAEKYASGMYERINSLWEDRKLEIFDGACGFSLISGPPVYKPPLLIIGANPGFGENDFKPDIETKWPESSYIPTANWPLAAKLRKIFQENDNLGLLDHAMQTNFQFFKSSSIKKPGRFRWADLPLALRRDLDKKCAEELSGFVEASSPAAILVLGLESFDRYSIDAATEMLDQKGSRRLLVRGTVFNTPAWGVPHPTGSFIADEDWQRVKSAMEKQLVTD